MKIRHWFKAVLMLTLVSVCFAGCNTMEGMGRDIERGGEEVQEAAD